MQINRAIRKTRLGKRDKRGRIRQVKGEMYGCKMRFQIADNETSDAEANRRLDIIHSLYEKQCKRSGITEWHTWCFHVAREIGAGRTITDTFLLSILNNSQPTVSATASQLRSWGIPVVVEDQHEFEQGLSVNKEQIENMVADLVQQKMSEIKQVRGSVTDVVRLPDAMVMTESSTLFDAMDSYIRHLEETGERESLPERQGELKAKVYKNIKDVGRLKAQYENMPLWKLDIHQWEKLVTILKNRPIAMRTKKRCSKTWASQQMKLLYRIARWLHTSPKFDWRKPDGYDEIDRKPIDLPEDDDNGSIFQTVTTPTYTPEELGMILQCCKPFEKTMIATCVNCAFGQSEIGQWKTSKIAINKKHPYGKKIDFKSTDSDSWIVGPRPKTKLYGEHLLWEEVAESLKPFLGRELLWYTSTGKTIYKPYSKKPSSEIDKWWENLIKGRVQKQFDIGWLPFGSLRDILPDILTRDYAEKVASLALQHKSFPEDKLLKCYANLPFKQLFEATVELRVMFEPMLKESRR